MTLDEAQEDLINYWFSLADEALESAQSEALSGRGRFALNRAYYACFYAASAFLLQEGRKFVKHTGVRAAIHQDMIKTHRLQHDFGETYDRLFDARQEADYGEMIHFDDEKVRFEIEQAGKFVAEIKRLACKN